MADLSNPELNIYQVKADLLISEKAIEEAKIQTPRFSKYLRGQAAYHLQQAAEKLIKIQLYHAGKKLDHAKIYNHSIGSLLVYADDLKIDIIVPAIVRKNDELITSWEAEGRYDVHMVVRTDTLQKYLQEFRQWYDMVESIPGIK
ncbi:MAG: hypothetical protein K6G81_08125 [Lachnospiraceae bacterium]|nr:hypothetical protein [Lachnospiraceae bacterium]